MRSSIVYCIASTLLAVALPAEAARLTDRQVEGLLGAIEHEVADLRKAVEPEMRKATFRGATGEVRIDEFLDTFEQHAHEAQSVFRRDRSADRQVRALLTDAAALERHAAEGASLYGAEEAWALLRVHFDRLADAYGADFGSDPSDWTVGRLGDEVVADQAIDLARDLKRFRRALDRGARDGGVETAERKAASGTVAALVETSRELGKNVSRGDDPAAEVSELCSRAERVHSFVTDHDLPGELTSEWSSIDARIDWLTGLFDG